MEMRPILFTTARDGADDNSGVLTSLALSGPHDMWIKSYSGCLRQLLGLGRAAGRTQPHHFDALTATSHIDGLSAAAAIGLLRVGVDAFAHHAEPSRAWRDRNFYGPTSSIKGLASAEIRLGTHPELAFERHVRWLSTGGDGLLAIRGTFGFHLTLYYDGECGPIGPATVERASTLKVVRFTEFDGIDRLGNDAELAAAFLVPGAAWSRWETGDPQGPDERRLYSTVASHTLICNSLLNDVSQGGDNE